jgi:diketogulonate reductase-like aldo/keto reductase
MIYKIIGNSKYEIPAIGQGTTGIGNYQNFNPEDVHKRMQVLRYGIDLGMAYLDTADLYGGGFSEETVGKIIMSIRDKVFIASKFNPGIDVFNSVVHSLEGSLKRLGTDYIDLYQIHWPNPLLPISAIMDVLSFLVKQGKIRYIGTSNFSCEEFKEAQEALHKDTIVSNQIEYNLFDRSAENDFLPLCETSGVTLIAYSAFNQGLLMLGEKQKIALNKLSVKYNKTISQIILRWLISHRSVVAITKSTSMSHTKENASSTEFDLEDKDIQAINDTYEPLNRKVSINRIRINISAKRPIYATLKEALANNLDLIPSPLVLSKIILKRKHMKPIRLVPTRDDSGKFDYDIDGYDIWDNVKKYWAWIIAYGDESEIPSMIIN